MSRGVEMRTNQTNHANGMGQGQLKIGAGLKFHNIKYVPQHALSEKHYNELEELKRDLYYTLEEMTGWEN